MTEWALLVNPECDDAARAWVKWLELDVTNLLKRRWEFVEAIANELLEKKTMHAHQFQAAVEKVFALKQKAVYPDSRPVVTRGIYT